MAGQLEKRTPAVPKVMQKDEGKAVWAAGKLVKRSMAKDSYVCTRNHETASF
jgi:hypothetical protein